MAAAGGVILFAGMLVLLAAIVFGLIEAGLDAWLAALIVAAVTLVIGAIVTSMGVKQIQSTEMAPKQTAETVRENVEFVREQIK
jgi:membrane protein